ncbi:MAG: hypothetical protein JWR21_1279 [Herminiimonas sp.]|nr:hypothetical protein [Herminiimonas sp.]MDB5853508.1 hypothetical protein [Herminiimonas sp.]
MNARLRSCQLVAFVSVSLVACGGGGGDTPRNAVGATQPAAAKTSQPGTAGSTAPTGSSRVPGAASQGTASQGTVTPTPSGDASTGSSPLTVDSVQAPSDASTVSGSVVLEITGSGIANAELLPASGFAPRFGIFEVSSDGTLARLSFDSTAVQSGLRQFRVSAFDAPAGDPSAREIVAMPTRTWVVINPPATAPILIQLSDLPFRDPAPLADLNRVSDAELQARLTNDWAGIERLLRSFIPANVDFGPPVPLGFYGPWSSCLQSHGLAACREHLTQLIGIMESKRPE